MIEQPRSAKPKTSEPDRLYVIGDIHGRADLLERMIDEIEQDLATHPVASSLTVTLGDYVDRGPQSRRVLDLLARNPFPTEFIALKGNHEALFERFLHNPQVADEWRHLGGLDTLHSYGIDVGPLMRGQNYDAASKALAAAVPPTHFQFLASLRLSLTVGRYFLCHAGVRPGVKLEQQSEDDLLWIRDEFLTSKTDFGKIVVHGHSPTEQPEILPNRIGIDTGAFITGRLTCVILEGERISLIST